MRRYIYGRLLLMGISDIFIGDIIIQFEELCILLYNIKTELYYFPIKQTLDYTLCEIIHATV